MSGVGSGALEFLPQNSGTPNEFAIGQAGTTTALFHVKHTGTTIAGTLGVSGKTTGTAAANVSGLEIGGGTASQDYGKIHLSGAGTAVDHIRISNDGGHSIFGTERSAGAGLAGSTPAYATVVGSVGATELHLFTNNASRVAISSSGVATFSSIPVFPANTIDSDHYVDGSIDTAHLAADVVTGAKIADDAINSEHYTDGSIDTAHIANNQVTGDKQANDRRSTSTTDDIYDGNTHDYLHYDGDVGIRFYTSNAEEMRLEDDGDLHVDGDVVAYSTTVSDKRLKHDINIIENALDKVGQLNGCTFVFDADGKESAGLIAQDVEKVLPSAVTEKELPLKTEDGKKYKVLEYDQTIGLLVEAIKELSAKVDKLENK